MVTYDLKAIDVLNEILRPRSRAAKVEEFYFRYRELHGRRPTAQEVWHAGHNPAQNPLGSWLDLVRDQGDFGDALPPPVLEFLRLLETTPMVRSYKMVLLHALLAEDCLPGEISIDRLVTAFRRVTERSAVLRADVGSALDSDKALRRHLESNPIEAWVGGRGTGGLSYFGYREGLFRSLAPLDFTASIRGPFREWVSELADWRLAEYLGRKNPRPFEAKVIHSSGRPIVILPQRGARPDLPQDWVRLEANGEVFEGNFVKIALNVVRRKGSEENQLPMILRNWFGPEAGQPGHDERVIFKPLGDGRWNMEPRR